MEDVNDEFLEHLKDVVLCSSAMFLKDDLLEEDYTYYEDVLRCSLTCIKARRKRMKRDI